MRLSLVVLAGILSAGSAIAADESQILIDGPEVDLTVEDITMALATVPADVRKLLVTNRGKLREVMDTTYITKVAAYRAREQGLDKTPEVKAQIWSRTENILAKATVDSVVAAAGEPDYEMAAKEYYQAHADKYVAQEAVAASHILIGIEGTSEADALQRITELRARIVKGDITFEEAARQYSADKKSAAAGGALGRFGRGQMVKPFEDAAFALAEKGALSEPVKSEFGYHLIRLDGRFPAGQLPLEQVKGKIIEELKKRRHSEIREQYLIEIRDDSRVKLNEDAIKGVFDGAEALISGMSESQD